MCGLAGIVDFVIPARENEARLRRMLHEIRHRGPDDEGVAVTAQTVLGAARLSLVDKLGGAQPMQSRDGRLTLVFNGEIYNHDALRDELQDDWKFRGGSDTEVLLAALATWGDAALPRLDGMFAFFLWDAVTRRGFAARDRLGVKPFTFARGDRGELMFASEAKAIVAARDTRPRAHLESILEYLAAPSMSGVEHSMFDGIEHLLPGHALWIDGAGVRVAPWWRHRLDPNTDHDGDTLASLTRDGVEAAVRSTWSEEHPPAIFLSGGLDSTLLAACARKSWPRPPCAYTIRFTDHESYDYARSLIVTSDDAPHAGEAARELALEHEWVEVPRDGIAADLAEIARIDDALPAWEQELAQHHLARAAARRHRAVLVGDAADELFYGYHFLLDDDATRSPAAILRRFGEAPIRRDLLAEPIAHFARRYRDLIANAGHDFATPSGRVLATTHLIVARWLPRLLHNGDIHTMAFGLEARVPFALKGVVELATRIPPAIGLLNGIEKWVLRRAATGLIPESIRQRRKSALPKDQGIGRLYQREARRIVREASPFLEAFLDLDRLRSLWEDRTSLDEASRALLFRVIALSHWSQHYGVRTP